MPVFTSSYIKDILICFRFTRDIAFPQVSVSLTTELKLGDVTESLYSPTTCSAVLVGGDQISDVPRVLERISRVTEDMMKPPHAIILFADEPIDMTDIHHQLNVPIVRKKK